MTCSRLFLSGAFTLYLIAKQALSVLPKRWIVERTDLLAFAQPTHSRDYERKVQTSETLIEVAMIRLLVARLGRSR